MNNERGSIPLVLVIVFTIGIAVVALTQVLLSEKITARDLAEKELEVFYNENEVLEFTTNLITQKISEKEWDGEITNQQFLETVDILEIEDILNNEILPYQNSKMKVSLTDLYSEKIGTYCEELYEVVFDTNEIPEFLGYSCKKQKTDIEFLLTIQNKSRSKIFRVSFQDLQPILARMGDAIAIYRSEMVVSIRNE